MLLAIDIGNSSLKAGLFLTKPGGPLISSRIEHLQKRTAQEYAELLARFLDDNAKVRPSRAAIASVVPELTGAITEAAEKVCGCRPLIVSDNIDTGIDLDVPEPSSVGADRIASAAGALALVGAPVVVVDFGTATTVNFIFEAGVPERGVFRGGAILPGLGLMAGALASGTAQLPRISPEELSACPAMGRDTRGNILSGMLWGSAGAVERIIAETESAEAVGFRLVLTGGSARHMIKALRRKPELVEPDLTLKGLKAIYERTHGK